jgi:hypothetical protein
MPKPSVCLDGFEETHEKLRITGFVSFSETGSVSVLRREEEDTHSVGSLGKS